jgi:hypothetical protein
MPRAQSVDDLCMGCVYACAQRWVDRGSKSAMLSLECSLDYVVPVAMRIGRITVDDGAVPS